LKVKEIVPHAVGALQRDLHLAMPPRRIECFDISHFQGTDSVASMVVFVDGKPRKSEYRKFKIESVQGTDDFASMREVIQRHYGKAREESRVLPDLIMVDGGKGQLSSAVAVLARLSMSEIPIIGLAKRLEEVFIPASPEAQYLPKASSGLKLLQQIRNEAHRFAITYHRTLRTKRTLQTELDLVEGIGKVRAKELLELFGSVQGVKFATVEQLTEAVGEKLALKIREYFQVEEGPCCPIIKGNRGEALI
jgi:excinuclease ABC subunit C